MTALIRTIQLAIEQMNGADADARLRLFACWCARQMEPRPTQALEAVAAAESFALGLSPLTELERWRDSLGNVALTAMSLGLKVRDPSAAACLAYYATLTEDAIEAAWEAASRHRMWARLMAFRNGEDELEWLERTAMRQANRLIAAIVAPSLDDFARHLHDPIPEMPLLSKL